MALRERVLFEKRVIFAALHFLKLPVKLLLSSPIKNGPLPTFSGFATVCADHLVGFFVLAGAC